MHEYHDSVLLILIFGRHMKYHPSLLARSNRKRLRRRRLRTLKFESFEPRKLLTTLVVDSLVDEADGSISDGDVSLRDALAAANHSDTIVFDPSLDGGTIRLTEGSLSVTETLTVDALMLPSGITIDASGNDPTPNENLGDGSRVIDVGDNGALTIRGLTITGGDIDGDGGGIRVQSYRGLELDRTTITYNHARNGGGIWAHAGLTITDSSISGNTATNGGGLFLFGYVCCDFPFENSYTGNMATSIESTTISNNSASSSGGGIRVADNDLTIRGSVIEGNTAGRDGGGGKGNADVQDTLIANNTAQRDGGGWGGLVGSEWGRLESSTIANNRAGRDGGGLAGPSGSMKQSTISGNIAGGKGGGVFAGTANVQHSTITGNSANSGGGVYLYGIEASQANALSIDHSILAGNTASQDDDAKLSPSDNRVTAWHSFIGDGEGIGLLPTDASQDPFGNSVGGSTAGGLDPRLGPLEDNGGRTPTHMPSSDSPVIDRGNRKLAHSSFPYDQRGIPRILGLIDIGAIEAGPTDHWIVGTEFDEMDGDHTPNDLSLREALALSTGPTVISFSPTIAGKTIYLTLGELDVRETTYISAASLAGLDDESPPLTINAIGNDQSDAAGDGSRIFSLLNTQNESLVLTGIHLTGGDAAESGGAVNVGSNGLLIAHSRISGNLSLGDGGAIFGEADIQVVNSTLTENVAKNGGGISSGPSARSGPIELENSHLANNRASSDGGGIHSADILFVDSSSLSNNRALGSGGGIASGQLRLSASTVDNNQANQTGGGVWANELHVVGSTVSNNLAATGGGLFAGNVILDESTVTANRAQWSAGAEVESATLNGSIIAGNHADTGTNDLQTNEIEASFSLLGDGLGTPLREAPVGSPDANGNLVGSSLGVGRIDPRLTPLQNNGGMKDTTAQRRTHLPLPGSPTRDAGDPMRQTVGFDSRGTPHLRIHNRRIDMGATETQFLLVDNLNDESDGNYSSGDLSLREALENSDEGGRVLFDSDLDGKTILLQLGQLEIDNSMTVDASNLVNGLTVDGQRMDRVLEILENPTSDPNVVITNLTLTGGDTSSRDGWFSGLGGGIKSAGTLELNDVRVVGNRSRSSGGGISGDNVSIHNSLIADNVAQHVGAVLASDLTLVRSTVSGNRSENDGHDAVGGIYVGDNAVIRASTISGNVGNGIATFEYIGPGKPNREPSIEISQSTVSFNTKGGIRAGDYTSVAARNSTISSNNGPGILHFYGGNLDVRNSTIVNNDRGILSSQQRITNSIVADNGDNFECLPSQCEDVITENPLLGPLQDNGGPTFTHLPLPGSPAVDASTTVTDGFDQRGLPFARVSGAAMDIGAVESQRASLDLDDDGEVDCRDIDRLFALINDGNNNGSGDFNRDGVTDRTDLDHWLAIAGHSNPAVGQAYSPADVNLDGRVDPADLNVLAQSWQQQRQSWCDGNLNGDAIVDVQDLNRIAMHWETRSESATTAKQRSNDFTPPQEFRRKQLVARRFKVDVGNGS